jgi:hypothetical protein
MMVLLADVRDDVVAASHLIASATDNTPDAEIARQLHNIVSLLSHKDQPQPRWRAGWIAGLLLTFFCGALAGWYVNGHRDQDLEKQATLMGHMDVLLVERYDTLPPTLRETLSMLYAKVGFIPPGQRTPEKKSKR